MLGYISSSESELMLEKKGPDYEKESSIFAYIKPEGRSVVKRNLSNKTAKPKPGEKRTNGRAPGTVPLL